jgi:predicted lipoprotein with Yx(FWY)xxD motif
MRRLLALPAVLLLALGLAACGGDDDSTSTAAAEKTTTTSTTVDVNGLYPTDSSETTAAPDSSGQAAEIIFKTGDTSLGTVLVTTEGMTLYFFDPDTVDVAACTGDCASAWPALPWLNDGTVGGKADPSLLGLADLAGAASPQATYTGHRLYTFSGDKAAGDTTGNGVGGKWHAVTPAGEAVA